MKCSDYIAQKLAGIGVDTVFGYTGGSIADLIDAISSTDGIRFVSTYHEQAAAFAACSYSTVKRSIGVAISSSGPGACNLLGGIANAYFDSLPVLFITGNVHSLARGKFAGARQSAFQETDIVEIARSVTKYAVEITSPMHLAECFETAIHIASEGRPGPVLIDIPYDIQRAELPEQNKFQTVTTAHPSSSISADEYTKIKNWLSLGKRPLVIVGGGAAGAEKELQYFLEMYSLPVVSTLRGLDIISHDYEHFTGFVGSYGNRYANLAVRYCDRLLVIGARLDERVMGWKKEEFAPDAEIVQIDIDPYELKKMETIYGSFRSDAKTFLQQIINAAPETENTNHFKWLNVLKSWKTRYPSDSDTSNMMNGFVKYLSSADDRRMIFCSDVGQNQMSVAQSVHLASGSHLLNSAGFGSMGYSLPAAVGAAFAKKDTKVISFNGDGGFQMNMQELQLIKRENLEIAIVIFNNSGLGLIRQLQKRMYNGRFYASEIGFTVPDFAKIAAAYELPYFKIKSAEDYNAAADFIFSKTQCVVEVMVSKDEINDPEPGNKIYEQTPFISAEEKEHILKEISECL